MRIINDPRAKLKRKEDNRLSKNNFPVFWLSYDQIGGEGKEEKSERPDIPGH